MRATKRSKDTLTFYKAKIQVHVLHLAWNWRHPLCKHIKRTENLPTTLNSTLMHFWAYFRSSNSTFENFDTPAETLPIPQLITIRRPQIISKGSNRKHIPDPPTTWFFQPHNRLITLPCAGFCTCVKPPSYLQFEMYPPGPLAVVEVQESRFGLHWVSLNIRR